MKLKFKRLQTAAEAFHLDYFHLSAAFYRLLRHNSSEGEQAGP